MSKNYGYKHKILYIYKFLFEETNENNRLTTDDLIKRLNALGISCERKSIYSDIETLRSFGVDIENGRGYYIASRKFENAELKILADMISSSHFITEKKSRAMIEKLESLTDIHSARLLENRYCSAGRPKTENERIYYNVDMLKTAIDLQKRVSFLYFTYDVNKKIKYRNGGMPYRVSPYCLMFSDGNYYIVAHYPGHSGLTSFRVDRMTDIVQLRRRVRDITEIMGKGFSLSEYTKKMFSMFAGERTTVRIRCDISLINAVIDRFGNDAEIYPDKKDSFVFAVNVNVSPTFYAWLFTFGDKMEIISPQRIRKEYIDRLTGVLNKNMHE